MLYTHPIYLITTVFLLILTNLVLDKGKELEKWANIILFLSSLIIIMNPLFNHRGSHILGYLFNNPITLEAIVQGLIYGLSLASIILLFTVFNLIFTSNMFTFLFSKLSHQWSIIIMLSMRFVPQIRRNIQELQDIQSLKGISMTEGSLKQRLKNGMQFIQMILAQSLEDSITVADSMTARGYGIKKPSTYADYTMKRKDYLSLLFFLLVSICLILGWKSDHANLQLQPSLGIAWYGGLQNLFLFVWLLFFGFILIMEGKEIMKWRFYQRRNFPSSTPKR